MNAGDVLADCNRRTAIVVRLGRKLTHLVPLEEGELVLRSLSPAEIASRGFRPIDYPLKKAVRKYLKHSGGVSPKARTALRALVR
ncbi:MAG TPA: hypothetical protein VJT81_06480 [Burkholderiales bacterium]|nr:hypothetical protein [Burkholderiales bacterium]